MTRPRSHRNSSLIPRPGTHGNRPVPEALVPLEPGDILYIDGNPADPTQPTHTITWLGQYGVDAATGKGMTDTQLDALMGLRRRGRHG
jgi:hypothetical protein